MPYYSYVIPSSSDCSRGCYSDTANDYIFYASGSTKFIKTTDQLSTYVIEIQREPKKEGKQFLLDFSDPIYKIQYV